ncbi:shikimate dehydrogenase [Aliiglaciecola sp. CAU 1673]|uniref:shikimate dehydrogenase n=1 Tax=Aliiglaciecola sp. CAU 1673 TaxID=3032595 RepID=UPI0023DA15BF|nr:shikimate dehydrogenase [Aliiglaciecola sp. CAU 1673]MDF2179762.1 shikimate dehydrogenase [Aliiglaciecola sp. CAU 1673]
MDKYAVIGNPVAHSKSPFIHKLFAEQTGQDMEYGAILSPLNGFNDAVVRFIQSGGKGMNVTLPFKEQAYALAQTLSDAAQKAEAVNTLIFHQGQIQGHNTDGVGLIADLHFHQVPITNKRVLLVGAGGAARGVIPPLLEGKPAVLHLANRTVDKALSLAMHFKGFGNVEASGLQEVPLGHFDLIINASSASLSGERPEIGEGLVGNTTVCYDMLYSREATSFNRWAKAQGAAKTLDGLGMLVEQAAESFYLWRGIRPQTEKVREKLREALMN